LSRLPLETVIWPVISLQLVELMAARWDELVVTAEGRRTTPQGNGLPPAMGAVAPNATAARYA